MKKIVCECCKNKRAGDSAIWVIYGSVMICESCRLAAIEWMLAWGFTFAHPFIREISTVESKTK
jgi:hypothetical protein